MRKPILRFFLFFYLFLFVATLNGQQAVNTTLLSVNDGLSQGMIYEILQCKNGYIWLATKDGLNRYDGSRFKVFSPDPFDPFAISDSEIFQMFEDSRGWIWVVLPNTIDVFDPISERFFHIQVENRPFRVSKLAQIAETSDGSIWCSDEGRIWNLSIDQDLLAAAAEKGSAFIQLVSKAIALPRISDQSVRAVEVNDLFFTQNNQLLVATKQGLYRLDAERQQLELEGLASSEVFFICQSKSGHILARHSGAETNMITSWIEKEGIRSSRSVPMPMGRVLYNSARNMIFDADGYLWLTQNDILKKYELNRFLDKAQPDIALPFEKFLDQHVGFNFHSILFDRSGLLWLGTNGFGIFKVNLKGPTFKSYLPKTTQRKIFEDPKGNLITAHDVHLQYGSTQFDQVEPNRAFFHAGYFPWQLSMLSDNSGNCWVTDPGEPFLYRIHSESKEKKAFPWKGFGLCRNQKGHLLSVNAEGLYCFDPATEQTGFYPFAQRMHQNTEFSHFLWSDSEDAIWIFGFEGLIKATPGASGYQFDYFVNDPKDPTSLSSNVVMSVEDDPIEPEKYLWVGTKSGGLNRMDKKNGKFKHYSKANGLPDNVVYGILAEDNGPFIWLSTNNGLCRFHVREESTKNFTAADGLQDNEFNSCSYFKTRNGAFIFGGVKGFTVFRPEALQFNQVLPNTRIVDLKVNNQNYGLAGKTSVKLAHNQNLLTFDFAALEFTNPGQNQYRYQLVGVDKDWVALGNKNSIQFANLAPGSYTFKVEGSNNDGAWSDAPAELQFTIRPPWWATWWACLIYLAALGTMLGLFYRYRLNQRLEHQENLRLKELDEFKSKFFTNITHEFRTPLTVILGMSEQLVEAETDAPKQNKLGLIKRSGENLLRLINQILDLAKLESKTLQINYIQGDALVFIKYIAESLQSLANAQNVLLRVESDQSTIIMDYDPERLLQIIHNLLSNAVKFTPSGGRVLLRADLKAKFLHVSVADTGAGIPADELPHLFERFFQAKNQEHAKTGGTGIGLSLAAELVKALSGEISVESTVGKGTTFLIKLPVTHHAQLVEKPEAQNRVAQKPAFIRPQLSMNEETQANESLPHILVIEDNPEVIEYLAACLQKQYTLDFAYNGRAGIEQALETIPDLIVSDVMMPEKNGFEVVEALKQDERTSHIPMILLTAKADLESRIKGLRRGADSYLSKPFHQEELHITIENLLETRRKLQARYGKLEIGIDLAAINPEPAHQAEQLVSPLEDAFLQKLRAVVEANLSDSDFEMPQLERAMAMSRSQIFRKVKALTGKSPSLMIRSIRLHHGRHLLQTTNMSASEIAYAVGYTALNNFSDAFQEEFGVRPTSVRSK